MVLSLSALDKALIAIVVSGVQGLCPLAGLGRTPTMASFLRSPSTSMSHYHDNISS